MRSDLQFLAPAWRDWVVTNINRGCDLEGMARRMTQDGGFEYAMAVRVIQDLRSEISFAGEPPRVIPYIDPSVNKILAVDREVDVLLTLKRPNVALLGGVLSDDECDELASYCADRMKRSAVVGADGGGEVVDPRRTSSGAMLRRSETELVARLEARLAALAHWPVDNAEGLQVLRYGPGNEYQPHFDWFDPSLPGSQKHLGRGGQRTGTFVIYLSDVEAGGGTVFPTIGLEVLPKKGGAVFFANVDERGAPDRLTLHGGSPVTKGVKFVANKWLREGRF